MNNFYEFYVYEKPQPKQRPRAVVVAGLPKIYTPRPTIDYEKRIAAAFRLAEMRTGEKIFFEDYLKCIIDFYFKMPKKMSKKKQKLAADGIIRPTAGGDVDNLAKSVLDALNGLAYADDKQIVELVVRKFYSTSDYIKIAFLEFKGE